MWRANKLTFKEAIKLSDFNEVWDYLITEYDDENNEESFRSFFELYGKLSSMEEGESDLKLRIILDEEKESERWDVNGYSEDDNTVYALDFVPWCELLGMEFDKETAERLHVHEIVAHCMWEMTFWGLDDDEIQEKYKKLIESTDETIENHS